MPANSSIGTRLAAVLLVPLLAFALLALVVPADPTGRGRASADTAATLDTAGSAAEVRRALAEELAWAMARSVRTGTDPGDELVDAVRSTQDAVAALDGVLARTSPLPGVAYRVEPLRAALAGLQTLRPSVQSAGATQTEILDAYADVLAAVAGLESAVVETQPGPGAGRAMAAWLALERSQAATARADAALVALGEATQPALRAELTDRARRARAEAALEDARFGQLATVAEAAAWREALAGSGAASTAGSATTLGDRILDGTKVEAVVMARAATARIDAGRAAADPLLDSARSATAAEQAELRSATRWRTVLTALGALVSVAVGLILIRLVVRPLRVLALQADVLATEQLPALLSQVHTGAAPTGDALVVDVPPAAEAHRLATAVNGLADLSIRSAAEQAASLRKGISELFVDLARRNQALLDRQIELIDQLEGAEQDPDQLDSLFRLDHLATRMRRNAESLLVLAGSEPPRRRGRPVPLTEVLRVAIGEVADYGRIQLRDAGDVSVSAEAAVDTAHLLAELMDNATQFSPPESSVAVSVSPGDAGTQVVTIADRGIGMGRLQIDEVNALLASPPATGLGLGRSLGFMVVARLAARHGIAVRLHGDPSGGGVVATVTLPPQLSGLPAHPQAPAYETTPPHAASPAYEAAPAPLAPRPPAAAPVAASTALPPRPPVGVFVPTAHAPDPASLPGPAWPATPQPPAPVPAEPRPSGPPFVHPATVAPSPDGGPIVQSPSAVPTGTVPTGAIPAGTGPTGAIPAGTGPTGAIPAGTGPTGAIPAGTGPTGAIPAGTVPAAAGQPGPGPGAILSPDAVGSGSLPAGTAAADPSPFGPPAVEPAPFAPTSLQARARREPAPDAAPSRPAGTGPAPGTATAPAAATVVEHVTALAAAPPTAPPPLTGQTTAPQAVPPPVAASHGAAPVTPAAPAAPVAPASVPTDEAVRPGSAPTPDAEPDATPRAAPAPEPSIISLFSAQARQQPRAGRTARAEHATAPLGESRRPEPEPTGTSVGATVSSPVSDPPAPAAPLPTRRPGAGLPTRPGPVRNRPAPGPEDEAAPGDAEPVRRSLREQLRASVRGQVLPDEPRPAPTQRSPEEVREMLARYRTGLARGRTQPGDGTDATGADVSPGAPS